MLGGGSFGTAVANMIAANGHDVVLWMRSEETAEAIRTTHENSAYMPGYKLVDSLQVSTDLEQALTGRDTVFFSVPSKASRQIAQDAKPFLGDDTRIISTAKGVEAETNMLPSQILAEVLPDHALGVISGPNLAAEIARFEITATVIASDDDALCEAIQDMLASEYFRVYANHDRYGVELAGALKNIYAIAAGIAAALGVGQNTQAVVLTRSLAEMSRFAAHLGANPLTFLGLAGVGDLYVTCNSPLSRNYRVGLALGKGMSLEEAVASIGGQTAEGVNTTKLVKELADEMGVYMPLASALYATLYQGRPIKESLRNMMLAEQNTDVEFMVKENG